VLLLGKALLAYALERWSLRLEHPPLESVGGLPKMLDFFDIRFQAERRGH
jgi:hypothetical protein